VLSPTVMGVAEGIFLHLMTQSFAVRALIGSLAAAALASLVVRREMVRSSHARRLLVLAPVVTAAGAAIASVGEGFLPRIIITSTRGTSADRLLDFVGVAVPQRELSVIFVVYAMVATILLARRLLGIISARRLLRSATPVTNPRLHAVIRDLVVRMHVRTPRLVQLESCPGGAFTIGTRRPVVAVDPVLLDALDDCELEGLAAHELAHIRRHDTLLGLVVGLVRDLAFFLPPLHLAARWLRSEQEESADECATAHTRRPVALASSILKVWDCSNQRPMPQFVCAAIGPLQLATAQGERVSAYRPPKAVSETTKALAARVERLIEATPALSPLRRRAEVALAAGVLAIALSAAVVVPSYLAVARRVDALSFGYLLSPAHGPIESPAFATFRALTSPVTDVTLHGEGQDAIADGMTTVGSSQDGITRDAAETPAARLMPCPCIESPAQLQQRVAAGEPPRNHSWSADGYAPYEFRQTDSAARELWTLSDSGPQVGVFLVTRPR
jgi:beta-lactamase regulating signal transducer with metallopeptidase domain